MIQRIAGYFSITLEILERLGRENMWRLTYAESAELAMCTEVPRGARAAERSSGAWRKRLSRH
jgi:hypothetical protein